MKFRRWLENQEAVGVEIRAFWCWDHAGTAHEPGGDWDTADWAKYLKMPIADIKKKYSAHIDYEYGWDGDEDLPAIEGEHYGWNIEITPEVDGLLMGNKACYVNDQYLDYYHDANNDAEVYITVKPEQLEAVEKLLPTAKLKPMGKHFGADHHRGTHSKNTIFTWQGLRSAVEMVSKTQGIRPPSSMPGLPKVAPQLSADPRLQTRKMPGEDNEEWLKRAVTNKFGPTPMPGDTYNPRDDYYKRA